MSEQLEVVQRAVGAFNARNIEGYMELYDPPVVLHGYAPEPIGFDQAKEFYGGLMAAFPDGELAADDVVQQGDKLLRTREPGPPPPSSTRSGRRRMSSRTGPRDALCPSRRPHAASAEAGRPEERTLQPAAAGALAREPSSGARNRPV